VVVVYRYPLTGKAIPELQKYIKRREVHFIDSQYPNNCVFEALLFLSFQDKGKEKRYSQHDRIAEGVILTIQYYSLQGSSAKCKNIQKFIKEYQEIPIQSDRVDTITTYDQFYLDQIIEPDKDDADATLLPTSLTLVPVKNKNRNTLRDFEIHVAKCQQNIAYERLDEFKPTRYFITYYFETVPRIINQGYGSKSVVNGVEVHNSQQHTVLEPLSVASTINSKSGIKKIYFDLRQENFIEKWLEQMFKEAKQLKEDNQYDDPEIPYDISIPVLGYSSAHLDMVFVIRYLTIPLWHITSYLGDFSHIKRVEVKHKITGVTLQFLDAMLFVTKGTL
ncbi:MAG: hypothetical protein EZS28_046456, partial [Streblomastix strix]